MISAVWPPIFVSIEAKVQPSPNVAFGAICRSSAFALLKTVKVLVEMGFAGSKFFTIAGLSTDRLSSLAVVFSVTAVPLNPTPICIDASSTRAIFRLKVIVLSTIVPVTSIKAFIERGAGRL